MSFGIGTNTEKANSGFVKGEQHEIACECWFTCSGKTTPIMIKIEDEDGEIRTIRQSQEVPVRLIHYLTECRWVLNFR